MPTEMSPLENLFRDYQKDVQHHENIIAKLRRSMVSIFKGELDSRKGSLRDKAAKMGVSHTRLWDASNGRRALDLSLVKKLEKLK